MKKVIIISPAYPLRGGISQSTELLCKEYLRQGFNCEIVSFNLQYPKFLFPGKTQKEKTKKQISFNITPKLNSINPISWFQTAKYINLKCPEYVIFRYWNPFFSPCLGFVASGIKNKRIKKIGWVDNVFPHKKVPFQNSLNNFFFKTMNGFIVMSHSVSEDLKTYKIKTPVLYSPHPIYNHFGALINQDIARKRININLKDKYVLFFGFVRKYKGLNLLIDAISDPRLRKQNVKLMIAGEFYENKKEYLKKIDKLNLQESVLIFDHYISNQDVSNYFCSCNLVAQPYLTATQSGVSMIAFHFQKPILVTKVGGLNEYIEHGENGYVVEPNPKDISNAILDFFKNKKEINFSKKMSDKKNMYSWLKLFRSFENLNSSI